MPIYQVSLTRTITGKVYVEADGPEEAIKNWEYNVLDEVKEEFDEESDWTPDGYVGELQDWEIEELELKNLDELI